MSVKKIRKVLKEIFVQDLFARNIFMRKSCEATVEIKAKRERGRKKYGRAVMAFCSFFPAFSSLSLAEETVNTSVSESVAGPSFWPFFRYAAAERNGDNLEVLRQTLPAQVMTIGLIKCLYSWLQTVCLIDSKKAGFALGGMRSLLQTLSLEGSKNISKSLQEMTPCGLFHETGHIIASTGIGAVLSYLLTNKAIPISKQPIVQPLIASIIAGSLWAFEAEFQISMKNVWSFAGNLGVALWRRLARNFDDNMFGFLNGVEEFSRSVMQRTMRDAVSSLTSGFFRGWFEPRNNVFADTHTKVYSLRDKDVLMGVALPFIGGGVIYSWTLLCSSFYRYFCSSSKPQNVSQRAGGQNGANGSQKPDQKVNDQEGQKRMNNQRKMPVGRQSGGGETTEEARGRNGSGVDPSRCVARRGGSDTDKTRLDPIAKWASSWLFAIGVQELWKSLLLVGRGFVSYDDFSERATKVLRFCSVPSAQKSLFAVSTAFSVYALSRFISEKVMTPVCYTLDLAACLNSLGEEVEDTIRRAQSQFSFRGAFLENFAEFLVKSKEKALAASPQWFREKVTAIESRMPSLRNSAVWVRILMRTLPEMLNV